MLTALVASILFTNCKTPSYPKVEDAFLAIPDSAVWGTTQEQRQIMLDGYQADDISFFMNGEAPYHIDIVDSVHNYMALLGNLECLWELKCWNLKQGEILIGVNILCCPWNCQTDMLAFYSYDGKNIKEVNKEDIIPNVWPEFFKGDMLETETKFAGDTGILSSILYRFSEEGDDIKVLFDFLESEDTLHTYFNGNVIDFTWDSGQFKKGNVRWDSETVQ